MEEDGDDVVTEIGELVRDDGVGVPIEHYNTWITVGSQLGGERVDANGDNQKANDEEVANEEVP